MGKSSRRTRRAGRADVMEIWSTPKQSMPVQIMGVLIRWRAELLVTALFVVFAVWAHQVTAGETLSFYALILGPIAVLFVVPPTRHFLMSRVWCVMDRHRIRTCLRNAKIRTMNLDGALPFLLWARPTKTGERVWMWIRAGSSADDLESVLGYIAPACYARDARIRRKHTMSTLVAVEIVRRDPLTRAGAIDSPLARLTSLVTGRPAEGTEPIAPGTNVTVLPVRSSEPARVRREATTPVERPPMVVGGEDLSDYID